MEKHYLEFDDSEENKLSYTTIFNDYVSHGWCSGWEVEGLRRKHLCQYVHIDLICCSVDQLAGETPGAAAHSEDPRLQHEQLHRAPNV